jgi:hypothetical protein
LSFSDLLQQGAAHAWLFVPSAILLGAPHEHHLEDVVGPLSREAREKLGRLTDLAKYL